MEIPDGSCISGVKNDGMSDQQNGGQQRAGSVGSVGRPGSAKSNRERQERIHQLKEKQDSERIKKLEELKEQAMAAARLREEQDSRRKKHFEDLVKKEDDRRRQAEERRRMLDSERKLALQAKWDSKKATPVTPRPSSSRPTFAFGSCTPRLIDNHVDGFLWKSQYNLNVTREPGMRASSAQDLHLQPNEVRMSASMYDWNQQRTTVDNPLVHRSEASDRRQTKSRSNYDAHDAMRVFCGRRKTDLTPTVPIKRDVFDMSASMMSRSTSRGSGRVYSSMTRLDRSRSPGGGNLLLSQHQHHPAQRPSRSKSTTHLSSTGLKLTRTEMLRQALVAKKETGGFRSVDQSRPPSSMSSSLMTSSTHSQVQMRPRSLVRKSRPASVHVTGVSQDVSTPESSGNKYSQARRRIDTSTERRSTASSVVSSTSSVTPATKRQQEPKKSTGKTSPSPAQPGETNTIKRPVKRSSSVTKDKSSTVAAASASKENSSRPPSVSRASKSSSEAPAVKSTSATPEPTQQQPSAATLQPEGQSVEGAAAAVENNATHFQSTNPFASGVFNDAAIVGGNLIESSVDENPTRNSEEQLVIENNLVSTQSEDVTAEEVINNTKNESRGRLGVGSNEKVIENFESIESAFASGSDDFAYSSKTPEPSAPTPTNENLHEEMTMNNSANNASSALDDLLGGEVDFTAGPQQVTSAVAASVAKTPDFLTNPQQSVGEVKSVSPIPVDSKTQDESAGGTGGDSSKPKIMTEEQAKAAIAEKRRLAREAAEREAARLEEEQRLEEERQRLEAEEAERIVQEARAAEEERLRRAIEEQQKKEAEEKLRREEEEKARVEKERQDREAAREAERIRLEMEERLKREEDERLERRKRVEAIMARTRKKEAEQQAKNNPAAETNSSVEPINGHKENNGLEENNVESSNNSLNNNYNNNNDFGGNNSTLIEFDGMGGQETGSNLVGEDNTAGLISNAPNSNPILSNPLQDLLS